MITRKKVHGTKIKRNKSKRKADIGAERVKSRTEGCLVSIQVIIMSHGESDYSEVKMYIEEEKDSKRRAGLCWTRE